MIVKIHRANFNLHSTDGIVYVDGKQECFSIEPMCGTPTSEDTAIPSGVYEITINFSKRLKRETPIVLNVPGFTGVRIYHSRTLYKIPGGIIVGNPEMYADDNFICDSISAFNSLLSKVADAINNNEKVTLEIR